LEFQLNGRCVSTALFERAKFLAQLIPIGLQLLGGCDRFAAGLIEGAEIAEQRNGVGPASAEFFFH
jgi:hypothetical protein